MRSSDAANRPRWRGDAGFFEIWFLVVFDPASARAWWLRYTTFAPVTGPARTTVWAAAFRAGEPPVVSKRIHPIDAYRAEPADRFGVRIGSAELANGVCRGAVDRLAWDLRFTPAPAETPREPALLRVLPLPTHVAHANGEIACDGWVEMDGARHEIREAPAVQKHIWGTRRVEELFWLYGGRFEEDGRARLEATAVRASRRLPGPPLTTLWLRTSDAVVDACGLANLPWNRVAAAGPHRLAFAGGSVTRRVRADASCDPESLAGYVYRDPRGWDVHVAQSDVASCTIEIETRPHPFAAWRLARRLTCVHAAAVEFHAPEPLPGVRYVAWDGTSVG